MFMYQASAHLKPFSTKKQIINRASRMIFMRGCTIKGSLLYLLR